MAAKEEVPEPVKEYIEKDVIVDKTVDSARAGLHKAQAAMMDHLRDGKGRVDTSKMHDDDTRHEAVEKGIDTIVEDAENFLKVSQDEEGDDAAHVYREGLVRTYTGQSTQELRAQADLHKDRFFEIYESQIVPNILGNVENELRPTAYAHLRPEHKADVLKHTPHAKINPEHVDIDGANIQTVARFASSARKGKGYTGKTVDSHFRNHITPEGKKHYKLTPGN